MRVVISEPAEEDMARIWEWIAESHPLNAERYVAMLRDKCESLGRRPRAGKPRNDLRPDARGLAVGPHIILYRIKAQTVQIVRVLDGRMDLENMNLDDPDAQSNAD